MNAKARKTKRLLYVSEKAGFYGGVERYIYDTAHALKNAGWKISMMYAEEASEVKDFLALFDKNFRMEDIDAVIAEEDFDLVMILKVTAAGIVSRLRLAFNTCVCVSDHDYYCLRRHKYFPLARINCPLSSNLFYCTLCSLGRGRILKYSSLLNEIRKCGSFIVLSEFMRKNLLMNNFPEKAVHKIYPVCPVQKIKRRKTFSKPPVIIFAGQLIRGKGVDLMLRALAHLKSEYRALIVGDGKDMDFLKKLASELGIAGKVEFPGWHDDITEYWETADIAVFPSRWQEPFGLTGIEAFAHKVPVVGFDVGGVGEWLHNGKNGLAVPAKDVTAMYVELEYLLRAPQEAFEMGEAGYEFVEKNFTPEKFVLAMDGLLKETGGNNV
ncbi:MAG: glycosyltransferase family 4 protein [Victivallaceae bacterium]|nr:glycosyltransferase family 4 protein [Victivallaceae bacterium]